MGFYKSILVGAVGLTLQGAASAQIYESGAAEGVPEFSDTSSPGSKKVNLGATNIGDPVQAAPQLHQQQSHATIAGQQQTAEQGQQSEPAEYDDAGADDDLRAAAYDDALGRERQSEHQPAAGALLLNNSAKAGGQAEAVHYSGRQQPRPLPKARVHHGLKVRR